MGEINELIDQLESMPPGEARTRLWLFIMEMLTGYLRAQTRATLKFNEAIRESTAAMNSVAALFPESPQS